MDPESSKSSKPTANMGVKVSESPAPEPGLQVRYQFIDTSDDIRSNSTQVRRHVMQEFMRQKRFQTKRRLGRTGSPFPEPKKRRLDRKPRRQKDSEMEATSVPARDHQLETSLKPSTSDEEVEVGEEIEEIPRTSPSPSGDYGHPVTSLQLNQTSPDDMEVMNLHGTVSPRESSFGTPSDPASCFDYRASSFRSGTSPSSCPSPSSLSPNPLTPLSAARIDPFDSLPMHLNREDHALVDFYMNVMPACSYGFQMRSENAVNWYKEVFIKEAMKSDLTFQNTVLVHAANTQAWVQGKTETRASIIHRARAISMLQRHFQEHPGDISDAVISATLSATAVEDFDPRPERKSISWIHMRAAMTCVRNRGGPSAFNFQSNRRLGMLINWQDYILAGYQSNGPSFSFDHESSQLFDGRDAHLIGIQELRQHCEIFVDFLRNIEHLALARITSAEYSNAPRRYSIFKTDTALHRLLNSPPGMRYTGTGDRKQMISRLASLININAALWEYRHSLELTERYLKDLTLSVLKNELDVHMSLEALLQTLIAGSKDPTIDRPDRPWFVGKMLKVAKRLCLHSWKRLNDLLLRSLMLDDEFEPLMFSWEDELRQEILDAPLTSFIMPALQGD